MRGSTVQPFPTRWWVKTMTGAQIRLLPKTVRRLRRPSCECPALPCCRYPPASSTTGGAAQHAPTDGKSAERCLIHRVTVPSQMNNSSPLRRRIQRPHSARPTRRHIDLDAFFAYVDPNNDCTLTQPLMQSPTTAPSRPDCRSHRRQTADRSFRTATAGAVRARVL